MRGGGAPIRETSRPASLCSLNRGLYPSAITPTLEEATSRRGSGWLVQGHALSRPPLFSVHAARIATPYDARWVS